jgi:lipoate-protein ligase A
MLPCRLFVDPPAEGAWNMAVDEALLDQAAGEGLASLRFYRWSEPTLSLGYFQAYDERDQHAPSRNAAVVRRLSGGGALIHDRELTYSLCLPASHPLAREAVTLYELVHEALIEIFAERGIAASLHGDPATAPPGEQPHEPFLCFARRTFADVVVAAPSVGAAPPSKIVGSAQRRLNGNLAHGPRASRARPHWRCTSGRQRPDRALEQTACRTAQPAARARRLRRDGGITNVSETLRKTRECRVVSATLKRWRGATRSPILVLETIQWDAEGTAAMHLVTRTDTRTLWTSATPPCGGVCHA